MKVGVMERSPAKFLSAFLPILLIVNSFSSSSTLAQNNVRNGIFIITKVCVLIQREVIWHLHSFIDKCSHFS